MKLRAALSLATALCLVLGQTAAPDAWAGKKNKDKSKKGALKEFKRISGYGNLKKWVRSEKPAEVEFDLGGDTARLHAYNQVKLRMSASCRTPEHKAKCEAFSALKPVSKLALTKEERTAGPNPGSLLCLKAGGAVRFGEGPAREHAVFCEFKDRSLIDVSSLYWFWSLQKANRKG